MNQPEIGMKVAELRKSKGITQEELASLCGVTTRTIQRVEAGLVDPRSYTLDNLGRYLEWDFISQSSPGAAWNACIHLSSCICIVPLPIIIWSVGRQYADIDDDAKSAINFQLTMSLILVVLTAVLAGWAASAGYLVESGFAEGRSIIAGSALTLGVMISAGILCFVEGLINVVKSLSGKKTGYFPAIRFLKRG